MTEHPTLPGGPIEPPGREFHPAANLFPLLSGAAFDELVADIRKNGLREPILVDAEGRILDGRNRYLACKVAGVEPRYVEWQGDGSPTELVLSLNLHRRHLGESQRALVAARLAKMLQADRPARGANLHHAKLLRSHDRAALAVNVSRRLLMHASKVLNDGGAELLAAVESGGMPVSTASHLAALPKDEQARVIAGGAKEVARKVRELRAGKGDAPRPAPSRSLGCFGIIDKVPKGNGVVFLWVESAALDDTINAMKAWGFRYTPSPS